MNFKQLIIDNNLAAYFLEASIGLEKEGQRILANGEIAKTPHPQNIGNRTGHPYIQTDFAESQVELITSPEKNAREVFRYLSAIHEVILRKMPENEYIWPLSMPGLLPKEEEIQVAQFDNPKDVAYREYLVGVYGKYKQMVSGIHYNYGFSQKFINALVTASNVDENKLRNELYMKLARQFIRYQYILTYLFGASPTAPDEYFGKLEKPTTFVRSLRTSKFGYVNEDHIKVSFDSVEDYAKTLRHFVDSGQLIEEKEFYSSVRFRGATTVKDLARNGIKYLEFRLFDINPYAPYGMLEKDIRFIQLFAMTLIWLDEVDAKQAVEIGKQYNEVVALSKPSDKLEYFEEANSVLNTMLELAAYLNLTQTDKDLIQEKIAILKDPSQTLAYKIEEDTKTYGSITELGCKLAINYKQMATEKIYQLTAFSNMEISTQALMEDAIAKGIKIDILDENDNFLKLTYKGKTHYIKNGNMTNLDSYISPLIMENKIVTKKILEEHQFRVAGGNSYTNLDSAIFDYPIYQHKKIVIKPKSTNFGLGITIFKNGMNSLEDFKKAVTIALKEDTEILIEEFLEGTEYRFFVLDDKTLAVLLRVPANVVGDGKLTIKELVDIKNASNLRGDGLRSPLKKIKLGEIECLQLKEQGLSPDSILEKGKIAYLRENSNISTGGDSIDVTDQVHPSYKTLAVNITKSMDAKICGVDLIIEDISKVANQTNYGVIETNFNPMMMMHIYPAQGKSHRLTENILDRLFET